MDNIEKMKRDLGLYVDLLQAHHELLYDRDIKHIKKAIAVMVTELIIIENKSKSDVMADVNIEIDEQMSALYRL